MKVEEHNYQENQKQVGVAFQRVQYHTDIDILPNLNPLVKSDDQSSYEAGDMSQITSAQTEERLQEAVQSQASKTEDEFLPIPLKRIDSGPHQHRLQDPDSKSDLHREPTESKKSVHCKLLEEIDSSGIQKSEAKGKPGKKDNTLTRILRGIKLDKTNSDETEDKVAAHNSISKIFQRINPVGKVSRENFSKVFQRIGDALQKRNDGEDGAVPRGRGQGQRQSSHHSTSEQRPVKIGEKMFRCRSSEKNLKPTA